MGRILLSIPSYSFHLHVITWISFLHFFSATCPATKSSWRFSTKGRNQLRPWTSSPSLGSNPQGFHSFLPPETRLPLPIAEARAPYTIIHSTQVSWCYKCSRMKLALQTQETDSPTCCTPILVLLVNVSRSTVTASATRAARTGSLPH